MRLIGRTALKDALAAAARRAGSTLVQVASDADPTLVGEGGKVRISSDQELPWLVARHVLTVLVEACTVPPLRVEAVVLAPAAGLCGPAYAGPVDAVRDLGVQEFRAGPASTAVTARMMTVQHTRCWVLSCMLTGPDGMPTAPRPDLVRCLPGGLSPDTAVATQFQHDRGQDPWWPGLVTLGPPHRSADGALRLLLLATEGELADALMRPLTGRKP
ncbi:hypothetical protein MF672_001035 [Actinomadura sp. ATCC 31491]|uniref:Uncharacterized protein n=1 Tax=Actinomadura luzonensis TaxID=2805427 RepID=A0ABT0FJA9_9ACTN|nr:hypothetical protein [Actinomadura luzonensis]MCK2212390.1 hypothetical protein [Actinomadura luzonensis]